MQFATLLFTDLSMSTSQHIAHLAKLKQEYDLTSYFPTISLQTPFITIVTTTITALIAYIAYFVKLHRHPTSHQSKSQANDTNATSLSRNRPMTMPKLLLSSILLTSFNIFLAFKHTKMTIL
jgi:hypothetical protein